MVSLFLIGGTWLQQSIQFSILTSFVTEEATVRDAASASALAVASVMPQEIFQNQYAGMLSRLATKEWFTARISAAGLITAAYSDLRHDQQEKFLMIFAQLCRDETPMVRRVASQFLGKMLEQVVEAVGRSALEDDGVVTTTVIPLYEELASNEQPVSLIFISLRIVFVARSSRWNILFLRMQLGCRQPKTVFLLDVS